jgi:TIR domain
VGEMTNDRRLKVFISHASSDRKAVDVLIDLIGGMGPGAIDVFCTSSPGFDVPAGTGFFQYIQELLQRSALIIHFITPSFMRSEFCKLELGAAWAQGKSFPMLAPPLTIKDIQGSPLASLQLVNVTSGDGLDKLRDHMCDLLGLPARTAGWADRRDRAIRYLREALSESSPAPSERLAAVGVRDSHLELWSLNAEGRVTHTWWPCDDGAERWNKPYDFQAPGGVVDVAVGSRGPGHAEVFAVDSGGRLWHRWWNGSSGWSGWHVFQSNPLSPPITSCSLRDGHIEVFAVDSATNSVIHSWSNEPGVWSGWVPMDEGI